MNVSAKAPGVIKLLGEHSVLYGKTAAAAAVSLYANAEVKDMQSNELVIRLSDLPDSPEQAFSPNRLESVYESYMKNKGSAEGLGRFVSENDSINQHMLPYVVIAARLMKEHKVRTIGKRLTLSSEIPIRQGLASSASLSIACVCAFIESFSIVEIGESTKIEIARDGERITHGIPTAGGIDVSTSFYGGYVTFDKQTGALKRSIPINLDVSLIDTGPKKSTAEMVKQVADLMARDPEKANEIMEKIQQCTLEGLRALEVGDMSLLGRSMLADHRLLKDLGVSTERLDMAVAISIENGASGAKLSGGGGGGLAIALVDSNTEGKVKAALERSGFKTVNVEISQEGAKDLVHLKRS